MYLCYLFDAFRPTLGGLHFCFFPWRCMWVNWGEVEVVRCLHMSYVTVERGKILPQMTSYTSYTSYIFINQCFNHPIYTGWVYQEISNLIGILQPRGHLRLRIAGPPPHPPPHYPPVAAAPGWAWEGELVLGWEPSSENLSLKFCALHIDLVLNLFISDRIRIPFNSGSSLEIQHHNMIMERIALISDRVVWWELPFLITKAG